jgi:hypothetical protein
LRNVVDVLDAPTVNNSVVPILDRKRLVHVGNVGGVLVIRFVERFYGCGSKVPNQQLFAIGSVSGASLQIECALQFVIGTLISCRPMVATRPNACFLLANFRKFNTRISIPIVKILSVGVSGQNTINRRRVQPHLASFALS